ncbi:MAG: HAMP domain-containing protein, partial [Oscillospiraceae bacterium]|nr:HAMP domain-containing protein [Oscillospiraceae bacterium]
MKIRIKLASLMLIILIIPIIVASAVYSSSCAKTIAKSQINTLGTAVEDRAVYLNLMMESIFNGHKSFTSDKFVREFARHAADGTDTAEEAAYINDLIQDTVRFSSGITDMYIVSDKGMIIAANKKEDIGSYDDNYAQYMDYAGSNNGFSEIFPPNSSNKCYMYSCRRIYDLNNKKIGISVQKISLEAPAEMLKVPGYSSFATLLIVDKNGKYISSSVSNPRKLEDVVEFRTIAENVSEAIPYYGDTVGTETIIKTVEEYTVFGSPVQNGSLSVVGLFESDKAEKFASDSISGGTIAVIVVTILASAAIIFVCFIFTEPIHQLIDVISKKNKGDVNVRLDFTTNDEFGQISTEFNAMFDSIFESEQRYRTVVSMMDNVVFEINLKTFKVYVSNNFNQKFSYRAKDDSINESFLYKMKVHKDDMKRYKEDLNAIVSSQGDKWEGEYRMKNAYGDF